VLDLVDRPVLLVGPHVPAELHWTPPTLVACVDPDVTAETLVAATDATGSDPDGRLDPLRR